VLTCRTFTHTRRPTSYLYFPSLRSLALRVVHTSLRRADRTPHGLHQCQGPTQSHFNPSRGLCTASCLAADRAGREQHGPRALALALPNNLRCAPPGVEGRVQRNRRRTQTVKACGSAVYASPSILFGVFPHTKESHGNTRSVKPKGCRWTRLEDAGQGRGMKSRWDARGWGARAGHACAISRAFETRDAVRQEQAAASALRHIRLSPERPPAAPVSKTRPPPASKLINSSMVHSPAPELEIVDSLARQTPLRRFLLRYPRSHILSAMYGIIAFLSASKRAGPRDSWPTADSYLQLV
jgi:hypothetical protein